MTRRICVVTAGHLATCPRMLKAADAFLAEGYDVRVVSTRTTGWATAADADIAASRAGVDGDLAPSNHRERRIRPRAPRAGRRHPRRTGRLDLRRHHGRDCRGRGSQI